MKTTEACILSVGITSGQHVICFSSVTVRSTCSAHYEVAEKHVLKLNNKIVGKGMGKYILPLKFSAPNPDS
jgi:hypothetical protein